MTQIPLLSGILASERADFNLSYPVNLEPVALENGISRGYLRSAAGAVSIGTGPGADRGAILWNGVLHRVMGTKLVTVDAAGVVSILGDVGDGGPATLQYSFDRLAIQSGTNLFYWNGTTLTQVTDPDLGQVNSVAFLNGQFFTTDGTYIVALQLSDPTQVDPLKYGSAEVDPDPITGLLVVRNELIAAGTNTLQFFDYVGGQGFPLQAVTGATIPIGCVGPKALVPFSQTFAFVGGARNQSLGIWLAGSGTAAKLSTRIIDDLLAAVSDPSSIEMEVITARDEQRLLVHLPDRTLVYMRNASIQGQREVWYVARGGRGMDKAYRPRNAVFAYNQWIVGDVEGFGLGKLDDGEPTQFGEAVGWQFDTQLLANGGKGAIVHSLELMALPGRRSTVAEPTAFLSFTTDGETWSPERATRVGATGRRSQRVSWRPHRRMHRYMGARFRGDSNALAGFASLEAEMEPLAV